MTTVTFENRRDGCYLGQSASLNQINEEIIVDSGAGVLYPGTLLGKKIEATATVTPGTPVSGSGQTVGNGAVGTWTADASIQEGTWQLIFTNEAADAGQYKVVRPDGTIDGYGTVAVAYDGGINGTIADGSNDWKEDDVIPIVVSYATRTVKYVAHDPSLTNGGQNACAILFNKVDATSSDKKAVATVRGPATINDNMLTYKTGISAANKEIARRALRALGMAILPQHAV
jgi:hypothetical protein